MLECACGIAVAGYENFRVCINGSITDGSIVKHCPQAGVLLCSEHFDGRGLLTKRFYCLECGELSVSPSDFEHSEFSRSYEERDVTCVICRKHQGRWHSVYRCGNLLCNDFGKNVCADHLISTGVLKHHFHCPRCGLRII